MYVRTYVHTYVYVSTCACMIDGYLHVCWLKQHSSTGSGLPLHESTNIETPEEGSNTRCSSTLQTCTQVRESRLVQCKADLPTRECRPGSAIPM